MKTLSDVEKEFDETFTTSSGRHIKAFYRKAFIELLPKLERKSENLSEYEEADEYAGALGYNQAVSDLESIIKQLLS